MTSYEFGDIVLVPFPCTDQTTTKKRPAVVISSDTYHQEHPDLIVMAVTSQIRLTTTLFGEVAVTYWQEAGLLKPSIIKPIIATVEKKLVLRKLGLQEADLQALRDAVETIIGG